jgi:hypothetical protein
VTELFAVDALTVQERHVLARGLLEWGGTLRSMQRKIARAVRIHQLN